jgi:hypothetical protein
VILILEEQGFEKKNTHYLLIKIEILCNGLLSVATSQCSLFLHPRKRDSNPLLSQDNKRILLLNPKHMKKILKIKKNIFIDMLFYLYIDSL